MRYHEIVNNNGLYESPQIVKDTDFNLGSPESNKKRAIEFLKSGYKPEDVIDETSDYVVFRTGDNRGYIVMIEFENGVNPNLPQINFYVKYEEKKINGLGKTVTQVALWRRTKGTSTPNITDKIFFGYLLKQWDTIVSDSEQTEHGRDFWQRRLLIAETKGLKVGFINLNNKDITWFDKEKYKTVDYWLDVYNHWGGSYKKQPFRYVIANK